MASDKVPPFARGTKESIDAKFAAASDTPGQALHVRHRSGCAAWVSDHPQEWRAGDEALCNCGAAKWAPGQASAAIPPAIKDLIQRLYVVAKDVELAGCRHESREIYRNLWDLESALRASIGREERER